MMVPETCRGLSEALENNSKVKILYDFQCIVAARWSSFTPTTMGRISTSLFNLVDQKVGLALDSMGTSREPYNSVHYR
jgi:hypothetical protein